MFTLLKLIFVCFTPLVNHLYINNQVNAYNEVVETKKRNNYFDINTDSSGTFYRYSLNALLSDSYWLNMVANFESQLDVVMPNGDGSNYTYNDVLNDNKVYAMNSSLYSQFKFYYISNNSLVEIPISSSNCFTSVSLYCENSSYSMKMFYLHLYFTRSGNTGDYLIRCLYNPIMKSFSVNYVLTGSSLGPVICFGFPAMGNPIALQEGTANSFDNGYNSGYDYGFDSGYDEGYDNGYDAGKEIAQNPLSDIYQNTYNIGYQAGRTDGINDASANSGVPALIFSGILNVALLPVDIFLQMFQYEVFGINIAGLISGLLTVAMVITVLRFVIGGKSKDD